MKDQEEITTVLVPVVTYVKVNLSDYDLITKDKNIALVNALKVINEYYYDLDMDNIVFPLEENVFKKVECYSNEKIEKTFVVEYL